MISIFSSAGRSPAGLRAKRACGRNARFVGRALNCVAKAKQREHCGPSDIHMQ